MNEDQQPKGGELHIVKWQGKFLNPDVEKQYCQASLASTLPVIRVLFWLGMALSPVIAYFDQYTVSSQYFPVYSLSLRAFTFAILAIGLYRLSKTVSLYETYHRITLLLVITLYGLLLTSSMMLEPHHDYYVQFDTIIIITLMSAPLLAPPLMLSISGVFVALSLLNMAFLKDFPAHHDIWSSIAYLFALTVGYAISIQLNFNLRLEFKYRKQLLEQADELRHSAYRDMLTGLYNRRAFDDHFTHYKDFSDRSKGTEAGVFVIMCDLDHFKQINDLHGHGAGDAVLKAFATLVGSTIRPSDGLYRRGGEEFVIVLSRCPRAVAIERIQAIIERLNHREIFVYPVRQLITASFGLTELRPDDDSNTVTNRADELLYQAKRQGRNCLVQDSTTA